ncbi:3',5'-nucleoside bisphosphate phosphatase [Crenobacter intestini]|uniref:PHP domain-containing protein n=1 Tax=Crenobacter intestini TaxID=2563443 RepID=A0A4T0V168_9NEIS|nr:3',5'-nucleoside bisphosphate phosphatase [Crenobacter intestini]TIC84961.1 PHP domain-containing protein [Crenobacter intestini]
MAEIDLHFHSTASDGALPPAEVVARAVARGARLLALTDHDTTAGFAEAARAAREAGVPFIGGVEVSVTWSRRTVHIVGLGVDPDHPVLLAGLKSVRDGRIERARAMGDELARAGIAGAFEGALALSDNPEMVGRTHFARYMVNAGYIKDVRTVFRKYLAEGKTGYVPHEWASLADAVGWIRAAGGTAVIAHPGRYDFGRTLTERLVGDFIEAGGEAIEVGSGSHSLDDMHKYTLLADRFGLYASSGSDFHAPGEGGRDVGLTADLPPLARPLWLARGWLTAAQGA